MRKIMFLLTIVLVSICTTVVAQPNVKIEPSQKEFVNSFSFDQKDEMKEFVASSLKELKEVSYLHKKIKISVKDDNSITVKVMATNAVTSGWGECSQTYWNAEVPHNIRTAIDNAGAAALGAACANNYHCVCYTPYYNNYYTGEGQWLGHEYCYQIDIYDGVCGCLNPAC